VSNWSNWVNLLKSTPLKERPLGPAWVTWSNYEKKSHPHRKSLGTKKISQNEKYIKLRGEQ